MDNTHVSSHSDVKLRAVTPDDAQELLNIYAYYVQKTAITFEYDVPSVHDFRNRILRITEKYPYIAAVRDGKIIGYAYAGPFHERAAYGWSAEATVYVAPGLRHGGIGPVLYKALEGALTEQNIINLYACIAVPDSDDEFLTGNSVGFHKHMGYRPIGEFRKCGYKFGRWYNMVWMEKMLGDHSTEPRPVISFSETDVFSRLKTEL